MKDKIADIQDTLTRVVEELCAPESYKVVSHRSNHHIPMPSIELLNVIVESLRSVLFPGYFGISEFTIETMPYYVGSTLDMVSRNLLEQIKRGYCFSCDIEKEICESECQDRASRLTEEFLERLPHIRALLSTDVEAAYDGDPAAKSQGETIYCYPSIKAITNYRIAHELYTLEVPLIPRIITELAHSDTGIDIHPGAAIGEYFFIDHGTGVVMGETTVIGKNVRIYQGVTLGAKSFPLDTDGNPMKGIPRHPIVEDDVVIYAGATILGRITIGKGSEIGGNVWLTHSVSPKSRIMQSGLKELDFSDGDGI
jgi:serine O-acetyltransferase